MSTPSLTSRLLGSFLRKFFHHLYTTMAWAYDFVAWAEADDVEKAVAWLLALGMQGNVRTTTMRAFDRDEITKIIAKAKG